MKKNIKSANGKKLETTDTNEKDTRKPLTRNVRMLVHKLQQVTPAAGCKLEAVATTAKPVTFYIGIEIEIAIGGHFDVDADSGRASDPGISCYQLYYRERT